MALGVYDTTGPFNAEFVDELFQFAAYEGPSDEAAADEIARRAREETRDLAEEIAAEIMEQPDGQQHEYGAIIYRDQDGSLQRTELVTDGTPDSVSMRDLIAEVGIDNIVATVHNHPGQGRTFFIPSIQDVTQISDIQRVNSPQIDDRIIHGWIVNDYGEIKDYPEL